ncbi:PPR domain-containing protein/PPR_2 domain-containing protein/PPR_3 domain-containing protein/DYW_deaminase domain-containing protein [Cephalotus follicularis]|uniref:PPR domain-containing protein/PPR_2 domain-containing protein/PPR_3 domain-containing protein/DYW_deaminase domain-containing protein n=1 Tax=Cephalotus follicularis TaxID=3775 RepID=A0A1Q3C471_CEPFO|nr:PPR domain-containing protein/PPR_2 domain-containing protein/PPR_3 domain-containing protein/DYW_deaminase domain-containing protein [Cephalotus follicularis]
MYSSIQQPLSTLFQPFSSSLILSSSLQIQHHHHQQSTDTFHKHFPPLLITTTSSPKPISKSLSPASWIESLRSKTRSNLFHEAILTYIEMTLSGIPPDNTAFPAVLKAVAGLQDLNLGKQIHTHVVKFGYESPYVTVTNSLVNMYTKCGCMGDVYKVFDRITDRDQVSWNSMIAAFCRFEEWELALEEFRLMLAENVEPSSFTLVSVALACSNLRRRDGLQLGKQVQAYSLKIGDLRTYTNNALMAMYAKLGSADDSKTLFELFEDRDLVTWNTLISSLSQNDQFVEAITFLRFMVHEDIKPDGVTVASVLPDCTHLEMLDIGREIHAYALKNEIFVENSFVGSALVDMYCNCREVKSGRRVFDSFMNRKVAFWNAMITGYAQNEHDEEAMMLFFEMEAVEGLSPNATTMASVVPACVRSKAFINKESIHGYVIKRGLDMDRYVQNALMDMYSRMGKIGISKTIFATMEDRDKVSWNTLITGYVVCGRHDDALLLLHEMQGQGNKNDSYKEVEKRASFKPNSITLMTVLPGCANLAELAKGKEIHAYAIKNMLALDVAVGSALVDMYAKSGCLYLSRRVFDQMPTKNVITWNVIIMAYGMHGKGVEALELFKHMEAGGAGAGEVKPNVVTFVAIFVACSHSGMVDEGLNFFYRMKDDYGVEPTPDHYACVVDLLGRAGQVEEAYQLISTMPSDFDKMGAWSSLLGACRIHHNVDIGEVAAKNLIEMEPNVASHYVLLANIYSYTGFWVKATEVRRKMKDLGIRKEPGCSWIEYGDKVHKFLAGDKSHPESEKLLEFLEALSERMKKEGYVPDTSCVLQNVGEEEKETLLCGHSEKLAIAFGILNTLPGTTIRVTKNLRVCNDCHIATKFISKIVDREIILRDVRRFHHFRNGICSCGDYW